MSAGAGGSCREASTPPALKGPCRQNRTEASCPSLWSLSTGQLGSGHDQEADGHMRVKQDQQDRRPHVAGGEAMAAEKGGVPPGGHAGPRGPAGRMQGSRRWVGRGLAVGSSPQPAAFVSVEVLGDPSELVVFSVPCGSRTRRSSGVTAGRSSSCAGERAEGDVGAGGGAPWVVHPLASRGPSLARRDEAVVCGCRRLAGEVERFLPRVKSAFPWTGLPLRAFWGRLRGSPGRRDDKPRGRVQGSGRGAGRGPSRLPAASRCKPGRLRGDWEPTCPAGSPGLDPR